MGHCTARSLRSTSPPQAGKSRGRGIRCFDNLDKIYEYTGCAPAADAEDARASKPAQWVVQKYMENSMLIHRRKFDIRQPVCLLARCAGAQHAQGCFSWAVVVSLYIKLPRITPERASRCVERMNASFPAGGCW